MEVKDIKIMKEKSMFKHVQGFVETKDGKLIQYSFPYVDGEDWDTIDDYIDQIKFDFNNEFKEETFNIGGNGLFSEINKEELNQYYEEILE